MTCADVGHNLLRLPGRVNRTLSKCRSRMNLESAFFLNLLEEELAGPQHVNMACCTQERGPLNRPLNLLL